MDAKQKAAAAAAARIYQDFEPPTELSSENDCDTLLVYLPGFQKEQLRVQLSKTRELIISGERLVGDNTWQRFRKTVTVSPNCDKDKITAKFEDQILYIIQPKLITNSENKREHEKLITSAQTLEETQKFINEEKHPNNVKDEGRQKPTTGTNPFSTYQTGDAAENGETALSDDGKSGETSDEDALQKAATEKKNDGDVAEDDKMKGATNQKHEPDSDKFICKMDERASKGVGLATNVKMPRQVINLVLAVLLAIALGLYVKNSAIFWKKDEN